MYIEMFAPVPCQEYVVDWFVLDFLCNFMFLLTLRFFYVFCFHWFIHLFTFWGHLELAIWCEVPHCVAHCKVTPRYFVLGHFVLEMGCFLFDLYHIIFLIHNWENRESELSIYQALAIAANLSDDRNICLRRIGDRKLKTV